MGEFFLKNSDQDCSIESRGTLFWSEINNFISQVIDKKTKSKYEYFPEDLPSFLAQLNSSGVQFHKLPDFIQLLRHKGEERACHFIKSMNNLISATINKKREDEFRKQLMNCNTEFHKSAENYLECICQISLKQEQGKPVSKEEMDQERSEVTGLSQQMAVLFSSFPEKEGLTPEHIMDIRNECEVRYCHCWRDIFNFLSDGINLFDL